MAIQYSSTNNFQTKLFNETVNEYFDTVFKELISQYLLVSAKGGSGYGFEGSEKLYQSIVEYEDMPYHIHILNGMIPALKLYERILIQEDKIEHDDILPLLKVLLVGFTFHDLNKLVGKELHIGVAENLEVLCEKLNVWEFFKEWRDWLNELSFIALRTEKRTSGYSLNYEIKDEYTADTIFRVSRLADVFASQSDFDDIADFYNSLCKIQYKFDRLDELWDISYISTSQNIYTLLSQKLLQTAQLYILSDRKEDILFHLRNGFIYLGKPLNKDEQEEIVERFVNDDSNFDAIAETKIDFQEVNFGFLNTRSLTPNILSQIIREGFTNRQNVNFFTVSKKFTKVTSEGYSWLRDYLDEHELPFSAFISDKERKKNIDQQNSSYFFNRNYEEDKDAALVANLFALQKIRFKKSNEIAEWGDEFDTVINNHSEIFGTKKKPKIVNSGKYSFFTLVPLVSVVDLMEEDDFDLQKTYETRLEEVCEKLSNQTGTRIDASVELREFAQSYLNGSFEIDIEKLLGRSLEIPTKDKMCIFTAHQSFDRYSTTNAYAVSVLGFNNRTKNVLKDHDDFKNQVSLLFKCELDLRKTLDKGKSYNQLKQLSSCIYYDFGEYIIHLDADNTKAILQRIANSTDAQIDTESFTVEVASAKSKLSYNLYNVSYRSIDYTIDENIKYVLECLKIIEQTGLRIFTTGTISPYISHKEIFVFENSLPIIKKLGWDRIRIDEVKGRIQEIELLEVLSKGKGKQKVSPNLAFRYSQDARAVFTAFAELDGKNQRFALKRLKDSIYLLIRFRKDYDMSTMKQLAEIARQMIVPKSSSASQSSRIIRDALDIVKKNYKEGRINPEDREVYVGQICGAMQQIRRTNPGQDKFIKPFAEAVYDELLVKTWKMKIPSTNRLRDWVNEFAFWYSQEGYEIGKKAAVQAAIDAIRNTRKTVEEDDVITWLKSSHYNKNKSVDSYESDYRVVFQNLISKSQN